MARANPRPYPQFVLDLMAAKSKVLSQAQAFASMGMSEIEPLWAIAAAREEQIAPLLEMLGREREAAVHRISAASCYSKAGDLGRAVNLFRAALAGPLRDNTRQDVEAMLADCLRQLARSANGSSTARVRGKRQRTKRAAPTSSR